MKARILENHKVFEKHLRNAEKIVCCDAFLSNKSVEVVNMICSGQTRKTATVVNSFNPYKRKAFELKNDADLMKQLTKDLQQDKKCVFVCGSKTKAEAFVKSIEEECPGKNVLFYYGNMDEKKKEFSNVEDLWADVDLLIYTPVITCGVNYDPEMPTFDRLYVYGTPHSACVRDVFQATLRIRKLKDNLMFYAISKIQNNKQCFPVGFQENYEIIQKNKAFVNEKSLFTFEKMNDWVLWNYSHNKNEEGIKLNYYQSAFYDYLEKCGYENKKYTAKKPKAKITGEIISLEEVTEIQENEYTELQKKYYELTEDQKNSMRLFDYQRVFNVTPEVWETLERNKQLLKNIPVEFNMKPIDVIENEEIHAENTIDIYADNTVLKHEAIKQINKILGAENSLNVTFSSIEIQEKEKEINDFVEENSGLFMLRKNQGKNKTRYLNASIQAIYKNWNGCDFEKKERKTSGKTGKTRKKFIEYTIQGEELINQLKKL
jgi:hypothetical protein